MLETHCTKGHSIVYARTYEFSTKFQSTKELTIPYLLVLALEMREF